ncbi:AGAP003559-PA-like protein [Anopheles sinensis]|uniref:AGAP003559-PA-like protein n=1 Tax=Anopheles sinensis TaxID=74873 RepID=A0A084VDY1_ANOSI|nr:AGAP003559-PA-like protein [Anopheles sinensis]
MMSMTHSDQHQHHQARRRTMRMTVARNLLLLLAGCLAALLVSPARVSASAIPAASFPSTNGLANSASVDVGGQRRATSCVAVHPILKRRGVDPIDMPIDPIPARDRMRIIGCRCVQLAVSYNY